MQGDCSRWATIIFLSLYHSICRQISEIKHHCRIEYRCNKCIFCGLFRHCYFEFLRYILQKKFLCTLNMSEIWSNLEEYQTQAFTNNVMHAFLILPNNWIWRPVIVRAFILGNCFWKWLLLCIKYCPLIQLWMLSVSFASVPDYFSSHWKINVYRVNITDDFPWWCVLLPFLPFKMWQCILL